MVTVEDFPAFFAAVNEGRQPFSWQRRLVDHILTECRWPDRINAPTGSGKSSVIEAHIFVNAVSATSEGIRVPRRLVAAVDRRALVDNQYQRALSIRQRLADAEDDISQRVAAALKSLATNTGVDFEAPWLSVVSLRGGQQNLAVWRDDPSACGIICATPDMWGSRALFRGYGTSRRARPRDAGLLTVDTALVIDEAHLNRQLLMTARRIGQLQATGASLGVPGLQVVETSATPAPTTAGSPAVTEVGVREDDLTEPTEADVNLVRRLLTPKPVHLLPVPEWPGSSAAAAKVVANVLVDRARALKSERSGTVGVFVNTVKRALEVAELLRIPADRSVVPPTVVVVVGPMRPHDRDELQARWPRLLTVKGNAEVDYLVATQTLEVGADLDLPAAVTELAPAQSIVQRVGRVNRLGLHVNPRVEVIVPAGFESTRLEAAGPYTREDLETGLVWLRERCDRAEGLAAWAVSRDERPPVTPRRLLYQRLEAADADLLAATSQPLFDEFDLDLWLHDDLDPDRDQSFLVVRERLPLDASQALAVLKATPPRVHECFPVALGVLRTLLSSDRKPERMFRVRSGEVVEFLSPTELRPGDIVIVDSSMVVIRENVVHTEPQRMADDVYERESERSDEAAAVRIMPFTDSNRNKSDPYLPLLERLAPILVEDSRDTRGRRHEMADALEQDIDGVTAVLDSAAGDALTQELRSATRALRRAKYLTEVTVGRDENGDLAWVVVSSLTRRLRSNLRQVVSPSERAVLLMDHADAVGQRAARLGGAVGIASALVDDLEWAGRHHDDGKRDRRFQAMLGNPAEAEAWAKSARGRIRQARQHQARIEPAGWRHEQLSVVVAADADDASSAHRDLALRLVGTSHGHGRPFFPHSAGQLLHEDDAGMLATAGRLFDRGGWDDLIDATHAQWGIWGCAYLEALLRAADCQVSAEGS